MSKINTQQLLDITGVSDKYLRGLAKSGVIAAEKDGGQWNFEFPEAVRQLITYLMGKANDDGGSFGKYSLEKLKAETREKKAKAEKRELELALQKEKLLNADQTYIAFANAILSARHRLMTIPVSVALRLSTIADPNEVLRILTDEIEQALTEISKYVLSIKNEPAAIDNDGTTEHGEGDTDTGGNETDNGQS